MSAHGFFIICFSVINVLVVITIVIFLRKKLVKSKASLQERASALGVGVALCYFKSIA